MSRCKSLRQISIYGPPLTHACQGVTTTILCIGLRMPAPGSSFIAELFAWSATTASHPHHQQHFANCTICVVCSDCMASASLAIFCDVVIKAAGDEPRAILTGRSMAIGGRPEGRLSFEQAGSGLDRPPGAAWSLERSTRRHELWGALPLGAREKAGRKECRWPGQGGYVESQFQGLTSGRAVRTRENCARRGNHARRGNPANRANPCEPVRDNRAGATMGLTSKRSFALPGRFPWSTRRTTRLPGWHLGRPCRSPSTYSSPTRAGMNPLSGSSSRTWRPCSVRGSCGRGTTGSSRPAPDGRRRCASASRWRS